MVTTWLLAGLVAIPIDIIFSALGLFDRDSGPVAATAIFGLSVVGATLLRRHWHSLRWWISQTDDWLFDRPVVSVALYALIGILLSLGIGFSLAHMAFSGSLWGLGGWWRVWHDRRLRGDAAT